MQRLSAGQASSVVAIDYSFNEWASDVEKQALDTGSLSMYPFHDLVAEKLRSVLQQLQRNRSRFQDIYDLGLLIKRRVKPRPSGRGRKVRRSFYEVALSWI